MLFFIAHQCDKCSQRQNKANEQTEQAQESETDYNTTTSSYNTDKTCSYCGDTFSGAGYNYAMGECHQGSDTYYSKCSLKCCRESMQNDPNLDSKWK